MSIINNLYHLKFFNKKRQIWRRVVKDLFDVRVRRQFRLRTVDFAVTYDCNGKCPMCSAVEKPHDGILLTTEQMIDIVRQAADLGAIHVNLTGGEPTTLGFHRLMNLISGFNRQPVLCSMVTNCKILSWYDLYGYRQMGLDTLQVSLESMDATTHDRIRNDEGNWAQVMQAVVWALELRLNVCLSAVITKDNFHEMRRIIHWGKRLGVFVLLNPISGDEKLSIRRKLDEYYDLLRQGHVRADTVINWRGGSGCPAGIERIYITPYGDVNTCPHVHQTYGNLHRESLRAIYKRICASPLREYKRHCRHLMGDV